LFLGSRASLPLAPGERARPNRGSGPRLTFQWVVRPASRGADSIRPRSSGLRGHRVRGCCRGARVSRGCFNFEEAEDHRSRNFPRRQRQERFLFGPYLPILKPGFRQRAPGSRSDPAAAGWDLHCCYRRLGVSGLHGLWDEQHGHVKGFAASLQFQ